MTSSTPVQLYIIHTRTYIHPQQYKDIHTSTHRHYTHTLHYTTLHYTTHHNNKQQKPQESRGETGDISSAPSFPAAVYRLARDTRGNLCFGITSVSHPSSVLGANHLLLISEITLISRPGAVLNIQAGPIPARQGYKKGRSIENVQFDFTPYKKKKTRRKNWRLNN